jgi:serine/threonine-protein kinase
MLAKGDRLDRYEIVELLGRGGMGEVYRAYDARLDRHVALKIVRDDAGGAPATDRHARLLREARAVAALSHPNVLAVHDAGEASEPESMRGTTFIAMELVVGESLRARVGDDTVPIATRIAWMQDVARGLSAAHSIGVIHRDVKPENVMIGYDGVVKVLDFGIARRAATPVDTAAIHSMPTARTDTPVIEGDTDTVGRAGTLAYMAPEQLRAEPVRAAVDQFAWAVVAYELLTGASPWGPGLDSVALIAQILTHLPRPAADVDGRIPGNVSAVIERAMSKRSEDRFASMDALVEAISPGKPSRSRRRLLRIAIGLLAGAGTAAAAVLAVQHGVPPRAAGAPTSTPAVRVAASSAPPPVLAGRRRLVAPPHGDMIDSAVFAPDGDRFVYSDAHGFWVQALSGGAPSPLGIELGPAEKARFVALNNEGLVTWRVTLDGAPPKRLGNLSGYPSPSPDGNHLALCNSDRRLELDSIEGVTQQVMPEVCSVLAWSPDGRHIAVRYHDSLRVVSVDGAHSEQLLKEPAMASNVGATAVAWPEAGHIDLFECAPDSDDSVLREVPVDAEGRLAGAPRDLMTVPAIDVGSLSFAGNRLLANLVHEQIDVYAGMFAPNGRSLASDPVRVSTSDTRDRWPQWLPDGRVAYYSEKVGGRPVGAIYARAIGRGDAEPIVPPPVAASPFLALRGGRFLVRRPTNGDGGAPALRFDEVVTRFMLVGDGDERELFRGSLASVNVRCAGDDPHRCIVGRVDHRMLALSRVDLLSGEEGPVFARLPVKGDWWFDVSPDASTIVVTNEDDKLTVMTQKGSHSFTTTPSMSALQSPTFAPDGRSVLVSGIGFSDSVYAVGRFDLEGRGTPIVTTASDWLASPAVSGDGRWLAFDKMVLDEDVWLFELE